MNLRIINISFLSLLLASFSHALPQEAGSSAQDDLDSRTQLSIDDLRRLPEDQQSQIFANCIKINRNNSKITIAHDLYEAGFRLMPLDAFSLANFIIENRGTVEEVKEIFEHYTASKYLPLSPDLLSTLLPITISIKAIEIANYLINLGATAQHIDLNQVVFLLSHRDTLELGDKILTLPGGSYEKLHQTTDNFASAYAKGVHTIFVQKDAKLLRDFLKHVPIVCFDNSFFHGLVIKTAMKYPNLECLQLLIESKWIDFSASPVYPGWLGGSTPIEAPATQHLIASYLGAIAPIGIVALDKIQFDFEEFEKCLAYLLSIEGINKLPYGNAGSLLINWLYSYSNRPKGHPITSENYRRIIYRLREEMSKQDIHLLSTDLLKKIKEPDIRNVLINDAIAYLEKSPNMQNTEIAAPNRNERRRLEAEREKAKKKIVEDIKALRAILAPSQTSGSAVAASSLLRAKPAASKRAASPEQVRERPQSFASRFTSQLAAQQSAVLAQPARTSCGDAAAASSSNFCAVTQTVSADPLAEARAARQEALLSLAQQEAREQRRDASRNSRYQASNDHALLPPENQPARASSVTRPARGTSASHSRDTTPLDKRDATPQLRPLMLVKDFKTLKAYYDVLEQSGNEGALSKFQSLLKQLGSPETFWSAYKDFKQITARSKTGEAVKIIEFRLNDELRVYFKVTADNKLVLFGNPHHLQTKKNN